MSIIDPTTSYLTRKRIERETGILNDVESYLGLGLLAAFAGAVLIIWPLERKEKVRDREKAREKELKKGKKRLKCYAEPIGEAGYANANGKVRSEFSPFRDSRAASYLNIPSLLCRTFGSLQIRIQVGQCNCLQLVLLIVF